MLEMQSHPRFQETDALGHINNTVPAVWFESARDPLFRVFTPDLDVRDWRLILAGYSVQFKRELFYGEVVTLKSAIKRIGGSSFTVWQEAWQGGELAVTAETTLIHFDYQSRKALPLTHEQREGLGRWLLEASE
ncbi:acyl-CoA thioesterase [Aeromonas schubertii]|uniref:Thioesterase family protein n=1 Tax=Aeromonas schubertii TaxID=652 RepID=A0A0S2SNG4_9GAMM|nr:thioesterase family protein [Aeromonas schubertii]ALP43264.1 thioesterase family protein [Aeromonas schubertii]